MGSLSKEARKRQEMVHQKIMEYKKLGICDGEGNSIKVNGRYVAKPRGGMHRKIG